MSESNPNAPGGGDVLDEPYADDAERAEVEWLLARQHDPAAPPPSPEIEREYALIERLLEDGEPALAPASQKNWQAAVLQAAAAMEEAARAAAPPALPETAPPQLALAPAPDPAAVVAVTAPRAADSARPRRAALRWVGLGAGALAAAAVGVLVLSRPAPQPPDVALVRVPGGRVRGDNRTTDDGHAAIGDRIRMKIPAPAGEPIDLRVYRSDQDAPLVRCPGHASCGADAGGHPTLELELDAPGEYEVWLWIGPPIVAPSASVDQFVGRARGARMVAKLDVR